MNYGVAYEMFIDASSTQYRGLINQLDNEGRVFTPADTAAVTPNSDTPYFFACLDLRAEPMVFRNLEIEAGRCWPLQLIDWHIFNIGYAGSRTTSNGAGCTMIAGPSWSSDTPFAGDWLRRAAAAMVGIFGNDAAEAPYPLLVADSDGNTRSSPMRRMSQRHQKMAAGPDWEPWTVPVMHQIAKLNPGTRRCGDRRG